MIAYAQRVELTCKISCTIFFTERKTVKIFFASKGNGNGKDSNSNKQSHTKNDQEDKIREGDAMLQKTT